MVRIEYKGEEYYCYDCETEFTVNTISEDSAVSFCPFCGSEIENEQIEEDELETDEFDENEDY